MHFSLNPAACRVGLNGTRERTLSAVNHEEELFGPTGLSPTVWHNPVGADIRYAWLNKSGIPETGANARTSSPSG